MGSWESIKELSRELRKNQTSSEAILWKFLRNRKLKGFKFLRQHPIVYGSINKNEFFIVDFYCAEKKLIIELDGKIHLKQKEYDKFRTDILEELKYKILRFKNEELNQIEKVLCQIKKYLV